MRLLAVDVGGTSTRAVIVADDGRCLGYGVAGSGNPTASGVEPAATAIVTAAEEAMCHAGVTVADIAVGVAGVAGAGGTQGARLRAALASAGLATTIHLEGDLLATFCSGTLAADGYVLVSGTGAVAARVASGRLEAVRDGLGWLLGDRGSGFWIGRKVARAGMRSLDRQQPSALAGLLLDELQVVVTGDSLERGRTRVVLEILDQLYRMRPADLARFAPLAFAAADAGDREAAAIVSDAARELAVTLSGVVVRDIVGPFVFGGSVLAHRPSMVEAVVTDLRASGLTAAVTTVPDGIVGAAVLALRRGGVEVVPAVHDRIRTSLDQLR